MPEDNDRVFDISKPHKVSPSANSRPVIVGHHPIMNDPMVTENRPDEPEHSAGSTMSHKPLAFKLPDPDNLKSDTTAADDSKKSFFMPQSPPETEKPPAQETHQPSNIYPEHEAPAPANPAHPAATGLGPAQAGGPLSDLPLPTHHGHQPHNHHPVSKRQWAPVLAVLVLLFAYALLDAKTTVSLPFYIFRNTTPAAPATVPPSTVVSSLPSGFKAYKLATASFDYPAVWGAPVTTTDPGFSKRGTGSVSDGTHAYVVNFTVNKDVQLAFTSSKYLPASRSALYYDYLSWCTGTNDDKFYESTLHFATDSGIDTPTTVTCDQGPLSGVNKLNATTIVQLNSTMPDGTALGDMYIKNLISPDLPVVRVKDATMTNAASIKILLGTVKTSNG